MSKKIETLVFDLGGVFLNLDKQACIDAFKALGFEDVEVYLNEYEQQGVFGKLEDGSIGVEEFHEVVLQKVRAGVTTEQIDAAFNCFLLDIPEYKLDVLSVLKQKYRILMLSNTNEIMFDYICANEFTKQDLTVDDYFDELYLSYRMKCAKPSAAIFEKLIQEAEIDPTTTLYIDDAVRNIEAAKPFGFQTLLTETNEDFRNKLAALL